MSTSQPYKTELPASTVISDAAKSAIVRDRVAEHVAVSFKVDENGNVVVTRAKGTLPGKEQIFVSREEAFKSVFEVTRQKMQHIDKKYHELLVKDKKCFAFCVTAIVVVVVLALLIGAGLAFALIPQNYTLVAVNSIACIIIAGAILIRLGLQRLVSLHRQVEDYCDSLLIAKKLYRSMQYASEVQDDNMIRTLLEEILILGSWSPARTDGLYHNKAQYRLKTV